MGVSNYLARRKPIYGSREFGESFEYFILMELKAYQAYKNPELPIYYWRTSTGIEVDFVLGDMQIALEVKSTSRVRGRDVSGLKASQQDQKVKRAIIISFEKEAKVLGENIECLYWEEFLIKLWSGQII